MIETFFAITSGYSVVASLTFLLAYFWVYPFDGHTPAAKLGAVLLLGGVMLSQSGQLFTIAQEADFSEVIYSAKWYSAALMLSALGFCLLGRAVITMQSAMTGLLVAQSVLLVANLLLPNSIILPLGFAFGLVYTLVFALFSWRHRTEHKRQRLELCVFIGFGGMALLLLLGSLVARLEPLIMLALYSTLVSCSLLGIQLLILKSPYWVVDTQERVRATYAKSTLTGIDTGEVLQSFRNVMSQEKPFLDSGLTLAQLATTLSVTPHQLSELVNHEMGSGFSQVLRQYRVAEAKVLLLAEPSASVLSIGLSVGFASQSNFYAAFREVEGVTPGQFRKSQERAI